MSFNNAPLEYLTAFAIAFAAGVLTTVVFGKYIDSLKHETGCSV